MSTRRRLWAFTLIELLVVVAVILAGLVMTGIRNGLRHLTLPLRPQ